MKKVLVIALALVMLFTLASCGGQTAKTEGGDKKGSGTPKELLAAYGLDAAHIAEAAKKVLGRK